MKIVIVEDEIRIREGICRLVKKINSDYEVVATADNGEEGYRCVCEYSPDIVITDIMMPGMNGMEMLEKLKDEGKMPSTIVLSAYSDFSYAQKAIRLGVREYLTKPVTIGELTQALENLRGDISEKSSVPETLSSLNNVFLSVISGIVEANDDLEDFLNDKYGITKGAYLIEMTAYLGFYYEENVSKVKTTLEQILKNCDFESIILEMPGDMSLLTIIYNYSDKNAVEHTMQEKIRKNPVSLQRVCIGMTEAGGIGEINNSYKTINSYMHWSMIFGDDVIIMYPEITTKFIEKCVYPSDIETKMKAALYTMDKAAVMDEVKRFEDYLFGDRIYSPVDVKEAFSRFIWAAREAGKDVSDTDPIETPHRQLIERINNAKSRREMKDILEIVFADLLKERASDESVGLTVKKAIRIIHDHYKDGITLNETAGRLNITPEYLSSQFQKEMGINFSTYIRDYRIGKAKQLLLSGNMKVYEVAKEVGYQDSKYFSRVFRQVTGQKPDEYRKNR